VLSGLAAVELMVIFAETSVLDLIKKGRPDVLVKGADYRKEGIVGWGFVESCGGKMRVAPFVEGKSSTSTIGPMMLSDARMMPRRTLLPLCLVT